MCLLLQCVTFIPLPLFLSLSLPLQCLSKNINKTPWRECQQDASQGGDTSGEREQRQEAERWRERERQRERAAVWYLSILKTLEKCRCWMRGHFRTLSHAEYSFCRCRMFNQASRSADLGSLAGPHWRLRHDCNSKLPGVHLLQKIPPWCNVCEMDNREREILTIALIKNRWSLFLSKWRLTTIT